jgi:hypothetical protein
MIRKFTHYLLLSTFWFSVVSCVDDEVASPPKPSFQASKTTAAVGEEITFTITEVNADAVSLLPYGLPGGDAGVLVEFTDGIATVPFSYSRPGTFQAIVVANNHSGDGEDVKNVKSEPISITITSSENSISEFSFSDISSETTIDEDAKTIDVTVPYGTDITKLKALYTASGFTTVTVGGIEQTSGTTVNDFSSPKVYTVTADDGTSSAYTVSVDVTPIETTNTIKSISAVAVSTNSDERELPASVDNVNRTIVVYDVLGTDAAQFDSVRIGYELDGSFAILKYGGKVMEQDSMLNLTTDTELEVYSQDSASAGGIQAYAVYAVDAPKLHLSFPTLIPDPAADVEPVDFTMSINALKGTDVSDIKTLATTDNPSGVAVTGMKVNGATFVNGTSVDYTEPVELELTVNDSNLGVTYKVVYTVTVTTIP